MSKKNIQNAVVIIFCTISLVLLIFSMNWDFNSSFVKGKLKSDLIYKIILNSILKIEEEEKENVKNYKVNQPNTDLIIEEEENENVNNYEVNQPNTDLIIDYQFFEANHEILEYNICTSPKYDYQNTLLKEYLKDDIESDIEMSKIGVTARLEIDYFIYDFNADGLDDYLVCLDGYLFSGSGGNVVRIYIRENEESLRKILDLNVRLHETNYPNQHAPIAILNEKSDGYYAIVLPESNHILRYDKDTEWYEFHEGE